MRKGILVEDLGNDWAPNIERVLAGIRRYRAL